MFENLKAPCVMHEVLSCFQMATLAAQGVGANQIAQANVLSSQSVSTLNCYTKKESDMIEVLNGVKWRLVDENHEPVYGGDRIVDFHGNASVITSAEPPRHAASTGRVNNFFPSVFDLKWVEVCDE